MHLEEIFTPAELDAAATALAEHREPGAYAPGKWMVSPLNRTAAGSAGLPASVLVRDITLRTIEQIPGVVNTAEQRRDLLRALVRAGVGSVVTSCFRRGHDAEDMRAEVTTAKELAPSVEVVYANAATPADMVLAAEAEVDAVQVWSAPFLGRAMPVSAGAVYHRAWQGRDWRDLRLPRDRDQHLDRSRRLIAAGSEAGVRVSATINLLAYASEDYVAAYCAAAADAGAYEIVLADSSGGVGPLAWSTLVGIARDAAPEVVVGAHAHDTFGLGVANCISAIAAGAGVVELAVNGLEMGAGGSQAALGATVLALTALYGVDTGVDPTAMAPLAEQVAALSGFPVPWNEPGVGSGLFETATADEYEQEYEFDPLIHAALTPDLVGARTRRLIGSTTGPFGMWAKLREIGVNVDHDDVEPILRACQQHLGTEGPLDDDRIRAVATDVLATRTGPAR